TRLFKSTTCIDEPQTGHWKMDSNLRAYVALIAFFAILDKLDTPVNAHPFQLFCKMLSKRCIENRQNISPVISLLAVSLRIATLTRKTCSLMFFQTANSVIQIGM